MKAVYVIYIKIYEEEYMVEYRLNEDGILVEVDSKLGMMEEIASEQVTETFNAPVETGFWTKFKNFMFQEINLKEFFFQEVDLSLKLSPYEKKVFKEVKDFWTQDITADFKF